MSERDIEGLLLSLNELLLQNPTEQAALSEVMTQLIGIVLKNLQRQADALEVIATILNRQARPHEDST